ncbi:FAD-dependent oxidoreductase [Prevotella sp.]|uniref:FAD-dependent oxidoreductase n=1 Tax=Prevotella sp. TaxID=59823 RepID=UPI003AB139A4
MKHIIIGGVAGGATAAARIRRADEKAEIILVEKGPHISYANCGLPYYIGGVIADKEKLFVQTPESFGRRFNIDVRINTEAISIDTKAKTVTLRRKDGSVIDEHYDRLLLSPGSSPVRPPFPGIDTEGIFTLRTVEDTFRIKDYLTQHCVKSAVVVGGGFIGLEMAENLVHAGSKVSIVEMAPQVMAPVDFGIASHVHRELLNQGVALHLNTAVERFEKDNGRIRVFFKSGESIVTDLVLLSIGVSPNTALAKSAGIELGARGIKVDKFLQTSAKDVYAVGDAIEFPHPEYGEPWLNYLAGPANRQGRIVADNMVFGNTTEYEGAIGTSIAKVFDVVVASTGLPAKRLKQLGIKYQSSTTISMSHAGYYPGAFFITTKITFNPEDGTLYGAQCVGHEGVDKRIDQLAIIIKHKGTIYDLISLEQAYAPPFSSAKDPIAIAGYTAANIISGKMPVIYWREIDSLDRSKVQIIDTRTPAEFELGTISGAVNIPVDDIRERLNEIDKNKPVVVFCAVGLRGYIAARILMANGYDVRNLSGGYKTYQLATQDLTCNTETECNNNSSCSCEGTSNKSCNAPQATLSVDACGLQCPGPIMKLKQAIDKMQPGETIEVKATDPGFPSDAKAWCKSTGNAFLSETCQNGCHTIIIKKQQTAASPQTTCAPAEKNKTLICFSDNLDRAIATFILANGAAATGGKVSIFFTFWGLNVIKKKHGPVVKKTFTEKMFARMLPKSSDGLSLSKMNMIGMGSKMIRGIMKKKNIDSLESLIQQAMANGVEFIACQMTMDMMGIKKEELLDGVTVGGVASYMQKAEESRVNLFI